MLENRICLILVGERLQVPAVMRLIEKNIYMIKIKLDIKPLSINECWQGKRFKTSKYTIYEASLLYLLPNSIKVPKDKKLSLKLIFGLSSKNADWDNPIKAFVDVLQKKYKFNDKQIYSASVKKMDVEKGAEFVEFSIDIFRG